MHLTGAPPQSRGLLIQELLKRNIEAGLRLLLGQTWAPAPHESDPAPTDLFERRPTAPKDRWLHHHRNPNIRRRANLRSEKARRRDPNHREWECVDADRLARNAWIGGKPASPEVVAENRDRMCEWLDIVLLC